MNETLTTVADWTALIEDAIHERVTPTLDRIGGIEQLFTSRTTSQQNAATARVLRDAALEEYFAHVTLTAAQARATLHLLDLAAAYKPRSAVTPVADFLRRHLHAVAIVREGVFVRDLRRRALQVLEAYYPMPPFDATPAYHAYVEMLKQFTSFPEHAGYALARLLELRAVLLRDDIVRVAVRAANAVALAELVQRVLAFNTDEQAREKLGELYNVARTANRLPEFEEAVEQNNGKLLAPTSAPAVKIGNRALSLNPSFESQARELAEMNFSSRLAELIKPGGDA